LEADALKQRQWYEESKGKPLLLKIRLTQSGKHRMAASEGIKNAF